jgi:hypothetical protein
MNSYTAIRDGDFSPGGLCLRMLSSISPVVPIFSQEASQELGLLLESAQQSHSTILANRSGTASSPLDFGDVVSAKMRIEQIGQPNLNAIRHCVPPAQEPDERPRVARDSPQPGRTESLVTLRLEIVVQRHGVTDAHPRSRRRSTARPP